MLTGEVLIDGQELTDSELHALLHVQHDLVSVGGTWTYLAAGERARIAAFVRPLGDADASTVLDVATEAARDDDTEITVELDPNNWLARALAGTWQPAPAEHVELPDLVRIPLRDYQRTGLDWMVWLERNEIGGILADDMGLGKTAMLLALVAHDHAGPTSSSPRRAWWATGNGRPPGSPPVCAPPCSTATSGPIRRRSTPTS